MTLKSISEECRQILLDLADQNTERLNAKLEAHEENADAQAERTFALLSFDPSPEGEALRNYLVKCTNALFRGMANCRKYQARKSGGWGGSVGAGLHGTQPDWSGGSGRAAHEWGRSELPADESFGSSDRACKGSLPATVSKREQRRLQCQEEPRTVEKMVEDMLTAGNCAPGEILMSVLKLPLSGGGGP